MYEQGAAGEAATAEVLAGLQPGWISLHDYRWPGRRLANIDHIVVGPGGIFVIDSKNWTGDVRIDGQTLRQNGRSREKNVAGVADAALAVSELIAAHAHLVRGVMCFVGDRPLSGWVRDVMVCSSANLAEMLRTREPVLDDQQVNEIATWLDAELRSASDAPAAAAYRSPRASARLHGASTTQGRPARAAATRSGTGSVKRVFIGLAVCLAFLIALPILPAISGAIGQGFVGLLDSSSSCSAQEKSTGPDAERTRPNKQRKAPPEANDEGCD